MIKSLIITHGNLGRELIQVAEKILEQKLDIEAIALDWQGDGSAMIAQLEKFIAGNQGHKIVIFTDNLPGLLKFFCCKERNDNFRQIIKQVEQEAKEGINIISEYLGEKK
jgi:mannose/fructose-specific phosphotransferase system component IIA